MVRPHLSDVFRRACIIHPDDWVARLCQPDGSFLYSCPRTKVDKALEFHRMTQYPSNIALGRNCRFLGGPKTDPNAISRIKTSLEGEREHCEVMIN